jgi:hypothetical protein
MEMVNGFRGAVLLNAGNYNCKRGLTIKTSGVVLRGSGSGSDGSIINMTGQPHTCISVRGTVTSKIIGSYRKTRARNLRFSYRGSTQQPAIAQLQDVIDNN